MWVSSCKTARCHDKVGLQVEGCYTLKMKPLQYFETSVNILESTRRYIAKEFILQQQRSENHVSRSVTQLSDDVRVFGYLHLRILTK
jgi:hypothetical protein